MEKWPNDHNIEGQIQGFPRSPRKLTERDSDLKVLDVGGLGAARVTMWRGHSKNLFHFADANLADEKPQGVMSAPKSLPIPCQQVPKALWISLHTLQVYSPT